MDTFAYRDTWRKSSFQIWEISRVCARRQLGRAGGGMPPEDWALAPLPFPLGLPAAWVPPPCTLHPPTTEVASAERRDEGDEVGSLGQGAAGRAEAGAKPALSSPSSREHLTRAEMPPGGWAARWAHVGLITVLYSLCPNACLHHWSEHGSKSEPSGKDPKQQHYDPVKICCKLHCSLHILPHMYMGCSLLLPPMSGCGVVMGSVSTGFCGMKPSVRMYIGSAFGSHLPS